MNADERGLLRRIWDAVLNIGADPGDDEYTRTIKRIYWVSAVIGISIAAGASIGYFLAGDPKKGWLFLSSFVYLGVLFILGIRHPKQFHRIALALLVYFAVGSPVVTILMGGFWATDGGIMVGLLGPVMGLVFLRDRRPAIALFFVYSAIVLTLAIVRAPLEARPGLAPVKVWLAFLIVGAFIFGVMYFFVVQREKAHRLLA